MIDPLRHRAVVVLERDHEARLELHGCAELDRRAACVRDMQGAPLVRDLDPCRRQAGFVEKRLGLLQILFAEDAHAHALGLRLAARAFENETVMTGLGDAAKIEGIPVFVADDEAEEIHVEVSAHRQILHGEHRVARARDGEGRIVDGLWNAHGALQLGCRRETVLEHVSVKWNQHGRRTRRASSSRLRGERDGLWPCCWRDQRALAVFAGCAVASGADVCLAAAPAGLATRSGFRGRRMAQKPSTASVTAAPISDRRSGEFITNSSSRLMIEPASSKTAGIWVVLSTIS